MEIPACPDRRHSGSVVTRAGWYGAAGRRRQRWWCQPRSGERHRFTEPLPRLASGDGRVHACEQCQTLLEPWEGKPAPRLYGFAVADVAWALAQVSAGASYRSVADRVRTRAGRELSREGTVAVKQTQAGQVRVRRAPANTHAQLVSDWVELFAPVLWAAYAPSKWPMAVALDADQVTFRRKGGGTGLSFTTLAVVGYDAPGRPYVAAVKAVAGHATADAWKSLLTGTPGAPTWVVTDGGKAEVGGSAAAWRFAEQWRCEFHLRRTLASHFPEWLSRDEAHPVQQALRVAQVSPEHWRTYRQALAAAAVGHRDLTSALRAAAGNDTLIRRQSASRPQLDDAFPVSTGAVEDFFRRATLALDGRASTMSNAKRADALLLLLAMGFNRWIDESKWIQVLTEHLLDHRHVAARGRPARRQRTVAEVRASPSLPNLV